MLCWTQANVWLKWEWCVAMFTASIYTHIYLVASRFMVLIKMKINFQCQKLCKHAIYYKCSEGRNVSAHLKFNAGLNAMRFELREFLTKHSMKRCTHTHTHTKCDVFRNRSGWCIINLSTPFLERKMIYYTFSKWRRLFVMFLFWISTKKKKNNNKQNTTIAHQKRIYAKLIFYFIRHNAWIVIYHCIFGPRTNEQTCQTVNIVVHFSLDLICAIHFRCTRAVYSCRFWRLHQFQMFRHFSSEMIVFDSEIWSSHMHGVVCSSRHTLGIWY